MTRIVLHPLTVNGWERLEDKTGCGLKSIERVEHGHTPAAGYLITHVGLRAGIGGAIVCSIAGVLLTLVHSMPLIITGLAMLSSGVFIAQTAAQSHLRIAAPPGTRVTAAGLYLTCYYLGGTAAGVVPGAFWALGKWPACVTLIASVLLVTLFIALVGWKIPPYSQTQNR